MGIWVGIAMSRGVMTMTDPLDKLLRDAAGATPDPGPSRHYIHAGLAPELARRRRGERHARMRLTLAMAAALIVIMCGQLGSEDFQVTSELTSMNGQLYQVSKQGMGGNEMVFRKQSLPKTDSDKFVSEWMTQKAAHEGTMVQVMGYALGNERWFKVVTDYEINGKNSMDDGAAQGYPEEIPRRIKTLLVADKSANGKKLMEIGHTKAPDFTVLMTINGLEWDMNAWRVQFPGQPEIIYYTGLRHDGVRSKDGVPY